MSLFCIEWYSVEFYLSLTCILQFSLEKKLHCTIFSCRTIRSRFACWRLGCGSCKRRLWISDFSKPGSRLGGSRAEIIRKICQIQTSKWPLVKLFILRNKLHSLASLFAKLQSRNLKLSSNIYLNDYRSSRIKFHPGVEQGKKITKF